MEAVGVLPLKENAAESVAASAAMPAMRETVTVMRNGQRVQIYKDELEKELYKALYEQLDVFRGLDYGI